MKPGQPLRFFVQVINSLLNHIVPILNIGLENHNIKFAENVSKK